MKNVPLIAGVAAAIALAAVGYFSMNREVVAAKLVAPVKRAPAPRAGSPAELILMTEVISGATDEGTPVGLLLAEDLKSDGQVVLPKGTAVRGKVIWSRGEGSLDGMIGRPARLNVQLEPVQTSHGYSVLLAGSTDKLEIEFNRENTGKVEPLQVPDLETDQAKNELTELRKKLVEGGEVTEADLKAFAEKYRDQISLDATSRVLDKSEVDKVNDLLRSVRTNSSSLALLTGEYTLALAAVSELTGVMNRAGRQIDRMLSGRNIRAYIGTRVPVVVADESKVKPQK